MQENILFDNSLLKLTDLGQMTQENTSMIIRGMGTAAYAAPELMTNHTEDVDIYRQVLLSAKFSLGIVAFEVLNSAFSKICIDTAAFIFSKAPPLVIHFFRTLLFSRQNLK